VVQLLFLFGGVFGIYELLPAFLVSLLLIFIVSKATPEPPVAVYEEFDSYMMVDLDSEAALQDANLVEKANAEALGE
jgi:Na+/proline symporter